MHKSIDRAVRGCVWGKPARKKGMHLLNRESLCKPKHLGGLNLKSERDMNQAMIAKLAWRVLTGHRRAWGEVLKAKYGYTTEDGACLRGKQNSSLI